MAGRRTAVARPAITPPAASRKRSLAELIAEAAEPLPGFDDPAFGTLFDRYADRRVVLLGEASHGTAEFYRARAAITRHLVARHGYTIVAVEADWPDAAAVDRYIRDLPKRTLAEPPFQRFPTWMWRNTDVAALIDWLHEHNARFEAMPVRTGFYGLDIYNMTGSIAAVLEYLDRVDPQAAKIARERYGCLTPWQRDPATYGRAALSRGYAECEAEVIAQWRALLQKQLDYAKDDGDSFLDAAQNARLVAAAERYYRIMYFGGPRAGTCATRTCSRRSITCSTRRGRWRRRSSGRTTVTSATLRYTTWAWRARKSTSASSAARSSAAMRR
jgi:erythromycin esterase-like protein